MSNPNQSRIDIARELAKDPEAVKRAVVAKLGDAIYTGWAKGPIAKRPFSNIYNPPKADEDTPDAKPEASK